MFDELPDLVDDRLDAEYQVNQGLAQKAWSMFWGPLGLEDVVNILEQYAFSQLNVDPDELARRRVERSKRYGGM